MRYFQVLALTLLTAITLELGLIAVKLPTPTVHAAPIQAPGTAIEDPHDTLKRQIAEFQRELQRDIAGDRQRLVAIEQQVARVSQSVEKATQNVAMVTANQEKLGSRVNDDSKRLLMTCFMVAQHLVSQAGPAAATYPKNRMDLCRAGFWKAESFNNFEIPWGP